MRSLFGDGLSPEGSKSKRGVSVQKGSLFRGGSLPEGVSVWRGLSLEGVSVWRDLCPEFVLCLDDGVPLDRDPSLRLWTERLTHVSENITFTRVNLLVSRNLYKTAWKWRNVNWGHASNISVFINSMKCSLRNPEVLLVQKLCHLSYFTVCRLIRVTSFQTLISCKMLPFSG